MRDVDHEAIDIRRALALFGNLNVGKTTLFTKICEKKATDFRPAGSSITLKRGMIEGQNLDILDTPGACCTLFTRNEDEKISRDLLLSFTPGSKVDGAILVADARRLKRALILALQCAEYDIPLLFNINMIDEIESHGIKIDYATLAGLLGVPVVTTVATRDKGIAKIKAQLGELKVPHKLVRYPAEVNDFCEITQKLLAQKEHLPARGMLLLLLLGDKSAEDHMANVFGHELLDQIKELAKQFHHEDNISYEVKLANLYNVAAEKILEQVVRVIPPNKSPLMEKVSEWCLNPLTGFPIAMGVAYLMFLFVGSFGATHLVDWINSHIFEGFLTPFFEKLLAPVTVPFIRDMLISHDFGILPRGLFLALGLVAPILLCYYIFFGFLEEVGYLPRVSLLFDKIFQKIGLNGKGVLPLIMGFSCVTMAIMTTRGLDSKRERNIATFLLLFGIPCAPVLAVIMLLLGHMPITASLTLVGIITIQILTAGFILNKILKGSRTPLLIEIPSMCCPNPLRIVKNALMRTYLFLKEALPLFVLATAVVFTFDRLGGLALLQRVLAPVTSTLMGLPENSVQLFIRTLIRRESGFAELSQLAGTGYTNLQLLVSMLVLTFFAPCLNAFLVVIKENGLRNALLILMVTLTYAVVIGTLLNHCCLHLGITFS